MKIQEQITEDLKKAMLQKDESKKSLLRVVIGEFNRHGKVVEDAKATNILKTMLENAIAQGNSVEIEIINTYLPQQLSNDQLAAIIRHLISSKNYTSVKDMGKIMADLKTEFPGRYDGKLANEMIKENFK